MSFPIMPFDGQEFIDAKGIKWTYSKEAKGWCRVGPAEQLPLASEEIVGLMSANDKNFLDGIDRYIGGFGIIVDTKLLLASPTNPSGIVQGDIELVSESLDIECVQGIVRQGSIDFTPIDQTCQTLPVACDQPVSEEDLENAQDGLVVGTGLRFKLSDKFLDTLIIEFLGETGPQGPPGPPGRRGKPGTGDGPRGDPGPDGRSNVSPIEIQRIVFDDQDEITDTAVVDVTALPFNKLAVTKARIKIPDSSTPTSRVVATPLFRGINFGDTINDFSLVKTQADDLDIDVCLVKLAKGGMTGEARQTVSVLLSDFVNDVVAVYANKLAEYDKAYLLEVKEKIEAKDAQAKSILSSLTDQLISCEFDQQPEFCLDPFRCESTSPTTPTSPESFTPTSIRSGPRNLQEITLGKRSWKVGY